MISKTRILVLGAGGHAKAVVGAAQVAGIEIDAIFDDNPERWGHTLLGVTIKGPLDRALDGPPFPAIIGIADPVARSEIAARLNLEWHTLIHPNAYIHPSATIGLGVVCFAGVVIQPDVRVGRHAIVNANATVAHDCVLEDFVHLAPGVDLAGSVHIGRGTFVGTGAAVIPGVRIGEWTTIGAGAAVIRDLPSHVLAVGTPAKIIKILA